MKPKLLRILEAVSLRLDAIRIGSGYYTDAGQQVQRGQQSLDPSCLPGVAVYCTGRQAQESVRSNAMASCALVVEALSTYTGDHPEDVACMLAADIHRAVEATDRTLGGLLLTDATGGITWQSDEIVYPESSDPLVGVRVTYACLHLRRPGDPENL